jgi:hypothetical protein
MVFVASTPSDQIEEHHAVVAAGFSANDVERFRWRWYGADGRLDGWIGGDRGQRLIASCE